MARQTANTNMTTAKLPSLNALRALEAVARNRSFRRAADELFVTPAAITHQIKLLEEFFGFTLLERHSRGIELTEATKAALPQLQRGFDALSSAVGTLRNHEQVPQLTVGASPTLASRWLMPRLQGFLSQFPGIDVRLEANSRPGTRQSKRDIDIRFTNADAPGERVNMLFRVEIVPMCHPRLLTGPRPLRKPADLIHHTLLHGDGGKSDRAGNAWATWLRYAGVEGIDTGRGLQLDHSTLALDAATDGLGVTLASPLLAATELSENKVVVAFPPALALDNAYYLITSDAAMARWEVAAFHKWLLEAGAQSSR